MPRRDILSEIPALIVTRARHPSAEAIRAARHAAGLTQARAAALVYAQWRTWQDWEAGVRRMHPGLWELWQIKASPR